MSVRASAMRCSQIECSPMIFLPNAVRDDSRLTIFFQRLLGLADGAHAVMDAAADQDAPARSQTPCPRPAKIFYWRRTRTLSSSHLGVADVRRIVVAEHRTA